jgi:hypothetical protein
MHIGTAEIISSLALCVSVVILVIQYNTQRERRHKEITQFHTEILRGLSSMQQRVTTMKLYTETIRLQLRYLPDSDNKYELIEGFPALIEDIVKIEKLGKLAISQMEKIDTKTINRTDILLIYQEKRANLPRLEESLSSIEQKTLEFLNDICTELPTNEII